MVPLWLDVLDDTIRACAAHSRADLVQQLQHKRAQLLDPKLRVLVVGEAGQGKSQLINALLNAPVCAVGDDFTTSVPSVIQHADAPCAALVTGPTTVPDRDVAATERVPVPIEQLASGVTGAGRFHRAEIGIPRELLTAGLVLIDTPGLDAGWATGGLDAAWVGHTDAVLLVSDANRLLSNVELAFLGYAVRTCPQVIVALSKIDIATQWRRVAEQNRDRLAGAGIPATVIPVSATLRLLAAKANDRRLNAESGFPDLVGRLQHDLLTKPESLAPHTARTITGTVVEQLCLPLRARRFALDGALVSGAASQLNEAQRRLDELRRLSSRWQNSLADEISDLSADIEHDLRDRTRRILRRVDEVFDDADPGAVWEAFAPWLEENLLEAAEANFGWLVERSHWIAEKIAAGFPGYRTAVLPESAFDLGHEPFDTVAELEQPNIGRFTFTQKVYTGLRGSYGGLVMFGLVTSLAGMPLFNAVSVGAGALFGGKSLRDEGDSRLQRRQSLAKAAVQRHVEDFFISFSKDCKDVIRQVQRRLRDHFAGMAEDLQASILESARTAKQAADRDLAERDRHDRELQRELEDLRRLHDRANALALPATITRAVAA
ncbi:isoniazid inducible protein IniA [Rugosimonospora acidiphila]|uniref:Isoniazid inducible protein IniA n=1 Tax=Rugosimonospora acidiphila TaxID=556531 RepID=A0ABP9SMB6_9ACTN